jgi:beta-glucosidase
MAILTIGLAVLGHQQAQGGRFLAGGQAAGQEVSLSERELGRTWEPDDWQEEVDAEEAEKRIALKEQWATIEKEALEHQVERQKHKGTAADEMEIERLSNPDLWEHHPCLGFDKDACPGYPRPYGSAEERPQKYPSRGGFPDGFIWGLGTAAYQVEGGYKDGGRGASIWDTFTGADTVGMPGADCEHCCKKAPCPVHKGMESKGANGNVACDHYHLWRSDVALMKSMGLKNYRFSISWPRIYPTGRKSDGINEAGVNFYSTLIDELVAAGITPYVTLYHWDLPQGLLDPPRANGWWARDPDTLEPKEEILDEWLAYVDTCFKMFGDRVKVWVTFNEAWTFTWLASGFGKAPSIEPYNNISRDPYIAAHNVLRAHAKAVKLYRDHYQKDQGGQIGITNNCDWREPLTDSSADVAASERGLLFQLGWLTDPIFGGKGDYPEVMKRMYRGRLPVFTEEEKQLLNGSADFLGINHYGTGFSSYTPGRPGFDLSFSNMSEDGLTQAQSPWLYSAGWGFRKLLNWVGRRYKNVPIIVTEGGWSLEGKNAAEGAVDPQRMEYYNNYTAMMQAAIYEDGVDVRGYFAWSLLDNFEWEKGYNERFGLVYSEFEFGEDNHAGANQNKQPTAGKQVRTRKDSSCWLEAVWRTNTLVDPSSQDFDGCASPKAMTGLFADDSALGCAMEIVVIDRESDDTSNAVRAILKDKRKLSDYVKKDSKHRHLKADKASSQTSKGSKTSEPQWSVQIRSVDGGSCGSAEEIPAKLSGTTIIADFSVRGGPEMLMGFWDSKARAIYWGDGSTWTWDPGAADAATSAGAPQSATD